MKTISVGTGLSLPLLVALFAFLSLSACGRKGNPVPPEETITGKVQLKENHAQFPL